MDITNWTIEENLTGKFTTLEAENYWDKLRIHFLSYLVFPGLFPLQAPFPVKIGQVPPILNSKIAGTVLYNTEHLKKSYILKNMDTVQGSQNKMVELIVAKEFELSTLDQMTNEELKILCQRLDFESISRYTIHNTYLCTQTPIPVPHSGLVL